MIKKSNKISSTILFALFFCLLICSTVLPNAQATEKRLQPEAITVLESVVGIDTGKYDVVLSSQRDSVISERPKNELTFDLTAEQSRLQADVSFISNNFYSVRLPEPMGSTLFKQSDDSLLDMAKGFMNRYQSYTGNSIYGELGNMLNNIEVVGSFTKTEGNVQLEVLSDVPDELYIMWTYVDDNGVRANPKNIGLSFYGDRLSAFYDYWQLYEIKGGTPKISSEEAVEIALNALKGFSWKAYTGENNELVTVSEFEVATVGTPSLSYLNYIDFASMDYIHYDEYDSPRGGDQFALYPSWYIQIGFDKVYPGSVTGANVRVWGDTGEVSTISPMSSGGVLPVENSVNSAATTENSDRNYFGICLVTIIAIGVLCVCVGYVKVRPKRNLQKLSAIKVCSVIFCIILSSSLLMSAVPQASAAVKISETYASSWGQTADDMDCADFLSYYISYTYYTHGYNGVYENFGADANWYAYQYNTWFDQQYGTFTTIFHYGHMAGPNNMWLSDNNILYSSNVNSWVTSNYKFGFVWLWACMQANGNRVGMPAAWSNNLPLNSTDAYTTSDNVPYCFIGFEKISPSIFDRSFQGYNNSPAWFFIVKTYDYIASGKNIRNALDYASYDTFGCSYKYSPLYQGYQSWYPGNVGGGQQAQWADGAMKIYGSTDVQPVW
ncbi:MAG: hypothetical protein FWB84_03530 [Candidatus Bathyarchaeota archaeon]|uniref:hypothetical protein n=1 Tax=Candidatus Bathycorpusculum sp. TaxID=2994959 RepID=UPI00283877C7|nr:hypothetical protein [Candidatus Termiticorpusculum sp.]MCL2257655.1 hypothetical protein [Candidatus Termiticorpusculum sp.]MCL2291820.1 hypothetical protein [Candidatus Termiticorpusculum sp.]